MKYKNLFEFYFAMADFDACSPFDAKENRKI